MTSQLRKKVCESCGLTLNSHQYDQKWRENRSLGRDPKEEKRDKHNELLQWYLDSQNKKGKE